MSSSRESGGRGKASGDERRQPRAYQQQDDKEINQRGQDLHPRPMNHHPASTVSSSMVSSSSSSSQHPRINVANEEERVLPVRTPVAIGEQGEEEERPLGRQSSFEEHQQQTLDDEDEFSESEDDGGNASSAHGDADAAGAPNKNKRRSNFIETVYVMSNTPQNESAIGFAADGMSLEIRNTDHLSNIVLPKHFKHRNVSSFIRQLNNYGFRTIPSSKGVFQTFVHDYFLKGRHDLIRNIVRRTGEVRKKKTLYEQVCEFKQKEAERKRRMEELEERENRRKTYIMDLEAQNRQLVQERDLLMMENHRLSMMLAAVPGGGGGGGSETGRAPAVIPPQSSSSSSGAVSRSASHHQYHQHHQHHRRQRSPPVAIGGPPRQGEESLSVLSSSPSSPPVWLSNNSPPPIQQQQQRPQSVQQTHSKRRNKTKASSKPRQDRPSSSSSSSLAWMPNEDFFGDPASTPYQGPPSYGYPYHPAQFSHHHHPHYPPQSQYQQQQGHAFAPPPSSSSHHHPHPQHHPQWPGFDGSNAGEYTAQPQQQQLLSPSGQQPGSSSSGAPTPVSTYAQIQGDPMEWLRFS